MPWKQSCILRQGSGPPREERPVVDRKPAEATSLCTGGDSASVRLACNRPRGLKTERGSCATNSATANCHVAGAEAPTPQTRQEILRQALQEATNTDQLPPPSLAAVGRKLQCHSSYLQRKFPDLASQISRAYREYWSIHKSQWLHFAKLVTKSKSSEIAARGEYRSQRKVIRALPSGLSFRMPVVKEAWLETLKEWGLKPATLTPKATVGRG